MCRISCLTDSLGTQVLGIPLSRKATKIRMDSCKNAMGVAPEKPQVLFFPWLAYGHISPQVELGKRLSSKGLKVSLLSTPRNIQSLRTSSPGIESCIQLLEIEMPAIEGLDKGIENTGDLKSLDTMPFLKRAYDALEVPFEIILKRLCPDVVFFDMFNQWVPAVASKQQPPVQSVLFTPFGAVAHGYCCRNTAQPIEEYCKPPEGFPSSVIEWKPFEVTHSINPERPSEFERLTVGSNECSAIVMKSTELTEGKFLDYFRSEKEKRVLPLGPLLPSDYGLRKASSQQKFMDWLGKWEDLSVVYVALGSEALISQSIYTALALGLEKSNVPFLWSASKNVVLPEGFVERVKDRAMVVVGEWVPQREILKHRAVGGFLSHCGWSSVMESFSFGVATICLVVGAEGGINVRLLVNELKVGVEIERGDDGSLDEESACKAVRSLMVDEEGGDIKNRAKEIGDFFQKEVLNEGGLQEKYVDDVVQLIHKFSSP